MQSLRANPTITDDDRVLLISADRRANTPLCTCPTATCLEGFSQALQKSVIVAVTCKRWGCPFCGRIKVMQFANQAALAKPNRFITLTVDNSLHETPRAAYDATRRKVPDLVKRIRAEHGEFEFMRVLEVAKKGWPHYHFIARSGYIPQTWLSTNWAELTGAPIVDIRKIRKHEDAFFYVTKYLAKQHYIPWMKRRVTFSKGYTPKVPETEKLSLQLEEIKRHIVHPDAYIAWHFAGFELEKISHLVYHVIGPQKEKKECETP